MTTFYFVRHGEPDYPSVGDWSSIPFGKALAGLTRTGETQIRSAALLLKEEQPRIIISSPYTRALQSASILSCELQIPLRVERDLYEWESDRTHMVRDEQELLRLCQDHDACDGIHPVGSEKLWESRQQVRDRVCRVLEKYLDYERVIVAGHAIMMQDVTEEHRVFAYGEIVEWNWENKEEYKK